MAQNRISFSTLVLAVGTLFMTLVACVPEIIGPDPRVAQDIATRIGTQPSWEAILEYLNRAFVPGKIRDEVHEVLAKIGPYKVIHSDPDNGVWDPTTKQLVYQETIQFTEANTFAALKKWIFAYDKSDNLVKASRLES